MLARNYIWPELFLIFTLFMLFTVPRERIAKLLPLGLVTGFGGSVVLLIILVKITGLWGFTYPGAFSVFGFSLWAALIWLPEVIVYTEYLAMPDSRRALFGYVFAYSFTTALFVEWLRNLDYLTFNGWSIFFTFLVAILLHSIVTYFAMKYNLVKDRRVFQ